MSDREVQPVADCDGWAVTTDHPFAGMTVAVGPADDQQEGRVVSIEEYHGDPTRLNVDVGPTDEQEIVNIAPDSDRVVIR